MNELKVFQNKEFGEVRSLIIGGEPWFVGKDVTNILGYKNGSRDMLMKKIEVVPKWYHLAENK